MKQPTLPEAMPCVDELFDDVEQYRYSYPTAKNLPAFVRPLIEALHDSRPDAVIAADRGGRPIAYAILQGWKHRYPGERFVSNDSKIYFARLSRSVNPQYIKPLVEATLERSGIANAAHETDADRATPRIALIDDWTLMGRTIDMFSSAVFATMGDCSIDYLTICGKRRGRNHVVGNSNADPRDSMWNNDSSAAGVRFGADKVTPIPFAGYSSRGLRVDIEVATRDYYAVFNAAVSSGQIAACLCNNVENVAS